jgi:AraC-like DNA-binding protein
MVGAIAHQVGYDSAFPLSAAFTREFGVSPPQYRTRAAAG